MPVRDDLDLRRASPRTMVALESLEYALVEEPRRLLRRPTLFQHLPDVERPAAARVDVSSGVGLLPAVEGGRNHQRRSHAPARVECRASRKDQAYSGIWKNIIAFGFARRLALGRTWPPAWRAHTLPRSFAPSGVNGRSMASIAAERRNTSVRGWSGGGRKWKAGAGTETHRILAGTSRSGPAGDSRSRHCGGCPTSPGSRRRTPQSRGSRASGDPSSSFGGS